MKESTRWRKIAEAFATPKCRRTPWQSLIARSGICNAMVVVSRYRYDVRYRLMVDRLTQYRIRHTDFVCSGGYWFPRTAAGARQRATIARRLAAQALKEGI